MFFNSILNNGCRILENPLRYEDGQYSMDFEDLEKKFSDPQTSMMILCNPHNPAGNIWSKETLAKVGKLAKKYGVIVISDEIHCDLTRPGVGYVPFASVSEDCRDVSITCITPTKAFNIAGINSAAVCIPNPFLRHKVWRALNTDECVEPNSFATLSTITAFTEGGSWLDALREYVFENRKISEDYVKENIPGAFVVKADATYLLWIDLSAFPGDCTEISEYIREKTGLYITDGSVYGDEGRHFIRMNVACPRSTLMDGLERLKGGLSEYKNKKN